MRLRLPAVLLAACAAAACASPAERSEAARGRADAERDMAAGRPALVFLGLPRHDVGCLDVRTGLPQFALGCTVDPEAVAYRDAYNDATLAALHGGRLDPHLLGHKVTTAEAVAARFAAEDGFPLEPGGPAAAVPGGRFSIEVAPRNNQGDQRPYLFVLDAGDGERRELHWHEAGSRGLLDHDGTTLLLRSGATGRIRTFDLPRRLELQQFGGR
jgi:hypothetical protein